MPESVIEMINTEETRLDQLKSLSEILAEKINSDPGARDLAQLSKQYRETLKEIEEIEGGEPSGEDEIEKLLKG
jgi:hypothetical protein